MAKKLTATTPAGVFTRTTDAAYMYVCIREPVEGAAVFVANHSDRTFGVKARYVKDRGYVVSWHFTEAAARKAAGPLTRYYVKSNVVGVFPVENWRVTEAKAA